MSMQLALQEKSRIPLASAEALLPPMTEVAPGAVCMPYEAEPGEGEMDGNLGARLLKYRLEQKGVDCELLIRRTKSSDESDDGSRFALFILEGSGHSFD
jgi:hypothetical protein